MPKIKKNSRGTWEFVVDLSRDPATGHRQQARRSGFRTKKEAETEMRRLQDLADKGTVIKADNANIQFMTFAEDWLKVYAASGTVKPSTVETRATSLSMARKFIGPAKIKDFTVRNWDSLMNRLEDAYSKNSVSNIKATLSLVLDYAVECGLLVQNPTKVHRQRRKVLQLEDVADEIEQKYLSKEELQRFLDAAAECGNYQMFALMRLLVFSGMRIGEALGLEFKHIDFDNGVIRVRQTAVTRKSRDELQTPKTLSSIRDIDIDKETAAILRRQILERKKARLAAGGSWGNADFVFTRSNGRYLRYGTAWYQFKKLIKTAGITKEATPHILRHTHASLLAESGATLEQIQARLGHSNDEITRKIYLHITAASAAKAADRFADFMQQNFL